jgi:hypothetical protein
VKKKKHTSNIIINGEKTERFSSKIRYKARMLILSTLFNLVLGILARKIRQKKKKEIECI